MCNGALLPKILRFSLPLIFSGVLQLLFNAADMIVVGNYAGKQSLAAVGSCGSLYSLIINFFIGISVGAGVVVARDIGARSYNDVEKGVHTAMLTSVIAGFFIAIVGYIICPYALRLLIDEEKNSPEVMLEATKYLRAVMCGMPANLIYNYAAALLRSDGDTKRPLYILSFSGVANVGLNLLFVLVFRLGAMGVGIATAISQWSSCILVVAYMFKDGGNCHLNIKKFTIDKNKLVMMIKIGLPSGIQGTLFAVSNVMIQSAVNNFGDAAMAGSSAACNIGDYSYCIMFSVRNAVIAFIGQNLGANNMKRVKQSIFNCVGIVTFLGLFTGVLSYLLRYPLVTLYAPGNDEAIYYGALRIAIVCLPYVLCGLMDVGSGSLMGFGKSIPAMIFSVTGAVLYRIIWLNTVCLAYPDSIELVFLSYPISWILTIMLHYTYLLYTYKKAKKAMSARMLNEY